MSKSRRHRRKKSKSDEGKIERREKRREAAKARLSGVTIAKAKDRDDQEKSKGIARTKEWREFFKDIALSLSALVTAATALGNSPAHSELPPSLNPTQDPIGSTQVYKTNQDPISSAQLEPIGGRQRVYWVLGNGELRTAEIYTVDMELVQKHRGPDVWREDKDLALPEDGSELLVRREDYLITLHPETRQLTVVSKTH